MGVPIANIIPQMFRVGLALALVPSVNWPTSFVEAFTPAITRRDEFRAFAQDELEVSGTDHLLFPALWSYSIGLQKIPCRAWEGL